MTMPQPYKAPPASGVFAVHAGPPRPRVLLAEDDDALRDLVTAELERDGFEVFAARDGNEMAARLRTVRHCPLRSPNTIVMDVCMPGLSGLDILMELRAAEWTTPVVLISAFPDAALVSEAQRLDATLIAKPFDIRTLLACVHATRHAAA